MSPSRVRTQVGKYEIGRTIGEGTFAKVKLGKNVETGESVAIKVLAKEKVLKPKRMEQIKREISTMKLVRHPNIVQILEVLASRTKVYIVLELVTGGELFDKIAQGRLKEDEARRYFQQLINAIDYCHSRGVYHRDLKPENLLLEPSGSLKISDFGLSALPQQSGEDRLLHTKCGTLNYVAPEVLKDRGYKGASADLWSCGVILFVLMAGYLPFDDDNTITLYRKIYRAEFRCPAWFSSGARRLILRILDPDPKRRISVPQILENEWFKEGYEGAKFEEEDTDLADIDAVFSGSPKHLVQERLETKPVTMNAFELITLARGLNLSGLFEEQPQKVKREARFTSTHSANEIITKIEEAAKPLGFDVQKRNYKMKLKGDKLGRKGHISVATEIFEVAPSLFMVEVRKAGGDTLEYLTIYRKLKKGIKDIVWKSVADVSGSSK